MNSQLVKSDLAKALAGSVKVSGEAYHGLLVSISYEIVFTFFDLIPVLSFTLIVLGARVRCLVVKVKLG